MKNFFGNFLAIIRNSKINSCRSILNIIASILFFSFIVFACIKYTPQVLEIFKNTEHFRSYILSFNRFGYLIFITFQIIHILIPAIPGEVVQIAGGYTYGFFKGSILLSIGTLIGTILVFYITRFLGYSLVKIFVSKKKIIKFARITNSKKSSIIIFFLFLIPGIPKDIILYVLGLTPIKPFRLIIISVTARLPGIIGSAYIGSNIMSKNYSSAITVGIISVIIFIFSFLFRKKILNLVAK
jgi:uncharacterized membrane protein YdjX (TVP38/TMEM64 family)